VGGGNRSPHGGAQGVLGFVMTVRVVWESRHPQLGNPGPGPPSPEVSRGRECNAPGRCQEAGTYRFADMNLPVRGYERVLNRGLNSTRLDLSRGQRARLPAEG